MKLTERELFEDDVRGMSCDCGYGRIGDGHPKCYWEAVHQQKRKGYTKEEGK